MKESYLEVNFPTRSDICHIPLFTMECWR